MKYEDFIVQIGPGRGDTFSTDVLHSPAGQTQGVLRLPDVPANGPWEELPPRWRRSNLSGQGERELDAEATVVTGSASAATPQGPTPLDLGKELFLALFVDDVGQLFSESMGRLGEDPDRGLRLKLKLNLRYPEVARLADLPWELLYRTAQGEFLGLKRQNPIVRYLDVARPPRPLPMPDVLRIAVVISSPSGHEPLDLDVERREIDSALSSQRQIEVTFLAGASFSSLRRALTERPHHVVHFMGHGGFDTSSGEGLLYFEDDAGHPEPISGAALAMELREYPSVQLALLNACNTARITARSGRNPFLGVATALVGGGLPAVVAMQRPITDAAAIAFSRRFYRSLVGGSPVDLAVVEGRRAIHEIDRRSAEWGIPVLFMRSPDGELFRPETAAAEPGRTRSILLVALLALVAAVGSGLPFVLPSLVGSAPVSNRPSATLERSDDGDEGPGRMEPLRELERPVAEPPGTSRTREMESRDAPAPGVQASGPAAPGAEEPPREGGAEHAETTGKARSRPTSGTGWRSPAGLALRFVRGAGRGDDFWIGELEVSQALWQTVMGSRPATFRDKERAESLPVETVSWFDALRFTNRLTLEEGLEPCYSLIDCHTSFVHGEACTVERSTPCAGYRLPTTAEWRRAALAGGDGPFASGRHLSSAQANFAWDKAGQEGGPREESTPPYSPLPVGQGRTPNAWQIYDLHGNVWEWVWPEWRADRSAPALGGGYDSSARQCRVAAEDTFPAGRGHKNLGFRIVRGVE